MRKDLGWMNGWGSSRPEEYKKCREQKHELKDEDLGTPKHHGYNTLYSCDICGIQWHVDSSD
jgi:hypothetical protein